MPLTSAKPLILFVLLSTMLFSCGKKEDEDPPVIRFTMPAENSVHSALGTINVRAEITDNEKITSVTVWLADADLKPVDHTIGFKPNAKSYSLNVAYELENMQLGSGKHYLVIRADDELHQEKEYLAIGIEEVPRVSRGLVLIEDPAFADGFVYKLDPGFQQLEELFKMDGGYLGSTLSSYYQYLNLALDNSRGIRSFDLGSFEVNWERSKFGSITNMDFYEEATYVASTTLEIYALDHAGAEIFTVFREPGDRFQGSDMLVFDERVYVEEVGQTNDKRRLVSYFKTGFVDQIRTINFDIARMFGRDSERLLLFANENFGTQGKIFELTLEGLGLWEASQSLMSGQIIDVVQISPDAYVIAHTNGIYHYDAQFNSVTPMLSNVEARKLIYDPMTNEVIVFTSNQYIQAYSYSSSGLNLLREMHIGFEVRGMHLWYNR